MRRGIWAAGCLAAAAAAWALLLPTGGAAGDGHRVAAVLQDNGSAFWSAAWEGLRSAAAVRPLRVSEYPYYDRDELEALTETVLLAQVEGLAATAPQTADGRYLELLREARLNGIKLVFVDSDPGADCRDAFVGVDNREGGRRLGGEVLARWKPGVRILLLDHLDPSQAVAVRRQGFLEAVTGPAAAAVERLAFSIHDPDLLAGLLAALSADGGPTLMVSLSPRFTVTAASAVSRLGLADTVGVYGFGEDREAVEYVQKGVIRVLMAQDSRKMGETAADLLADLLEGEEPEAREVLLELTALTPENAADSAVAQAVLDGGKEGT